MNHHTQKCRRILGVHTHAHAHMQNRHTQAEANGAETRTWKKARKRTGGDGGWNNVRLFAIRTEWFPEGLFIPFKIWREEKGKAKYLCNDFFVVCQIFHPHYKKKKNEMVKGQIRVVHKTFPASLPWLSLHILHPCLEVSCLAACFKRMHHSDSLWPFSWPRAQGRRHSNGREETVRKTEYGCR